MHKCIRSYSIILLTSLWLCMGLSASSPVKAADPDKVLRYAFVAGESGFDPAYVSDLYSAQIIQSIFESLFTYDYLADPVKLVPLTASAMPTISADAKTFTITLKKGILFYPDPAFNGKPRELTMADYVYTLKRLVDPKLASPHAWMLTGKIAGLDALIAQAKKTGQFDYDAKVAGFELPDKYTLRIHLTQPDYNLSMILAFVQAGAVAREVIEKYRDASGHVMEHPIGTGPYFLSMWNRGSKMVLTANPDYRDTTWDFKAGSDPQDQRIVAVMRGKKIPQIGRIEITVLTESQARWLAFQQNQLDIIQLGGSLAPQALVDGHLKPELVKRGIQLSRHIDPELSVWYWNMSDPIVGGLSKEKIALRRALSMAHNVEEEIRVIYNGQAIALEYPIPPGVVGHDPHYKSSIQYDPPAANALLDKFGYKKGADGYRTLPDGKPLVIHFSAIADSSGAQQADVWKRTLDSVAIRMTSDLKQFSELIKAEKTCQIMTRQSGWIADYPDGDNFMQLFYGPNIGQNNFGCMKIPEFDQLYVQSQQVPDGPARNLLYHKMARVMEVYAAQRIGITGYRNMLIQARVTGYKKHPILPIEWMYFDVEKSLAPPKK